jgi:beta-phosphoglucomutase-like phosphatase (HAD superfamily)
LESIPVWITREQYTHPKPAPDAYLKAVELLADPGDRIIGFEDTMKGVKALQAAGVQPVLICDKEHPQLEQENVLQGVSHFETFSLVNTQLRAV